MEMMMMGGRGKEQEEEEEEEARDKSLEPEEDAGDMKLSGYEELRQQRIQENSAKLAALNLPSLTSSLQHHQRQQTQQVAQRLNQSCPSRRSSRLKARTPVAALGDSDDDDDPAPVSHPAKSGTRWDDEGDDDLEYQPSDNCSNSELEDTSGDEEQLAKALALSLDTSFENVAAVSKGKTNSAAVDKDQHPKRKSASEVGIIAHKNDKSMKGLASLDADSRKKRQKKGWTKMLQFTEDEISILYFLFDETGRGRFSAEELERAASIHDFTWTKEEVFDMINIFDKDRDGQLNLAEFRDMAIRCNLMKLSG